MARRAFTIAELLFAISAIAALSILAMSVIALLMTAEQHSAEALWVDVTVANFAADLREDAHDAVDVELRADEQGQSAQVTLVQPEQVRVTYECTAEGVVRRKQQQGDLRGTETYRLAFGSSGFEFSGEDSLLRWQHLREIPTVGGFSEPAADEAAPRRLYQITAAVGLHAAISAEDDK